MKLTLKRKTTASVLAVFTKAIKDLQQVENEANTAAEAAREKATALDIMADDKTAEAYDAANIRRKLEELVGI